MQVQAQFANGQKRQKLKQRLELPRFSAKSIPIGSDRGMRFEKLPTGRRGELLAIRVTLSLLPGRQQQPVIHIRLKDETKAAVLARIWNGYEARRWLEGESKRFKKRYQDNPVPEITKELLVNSESYPPSSSGSVTYDRDAGIFYVSIGYSRPKERIYEADPSRVMAIDVGISSPFTVAFNFGKQPFRMEELGKMIKDSRGEFYKRRRLLQAKFAAAPRKVQKAKLRKLSDAWGGG